MGPSALLQDVDLLSVSRLPNLAMLSLVGLARETLRDRIVRAWSRAASEAGALSKLRIFRCDSTNCFTTQTFSYLKALPALRMLLFSQASLPPGTAEIGAHWQLVQGYEVNEHSMTWYDMYTSGLHDDRMMGFAQRSANYPDAGTRPPALTCFYGQARDPPPSELVARSDLQVLIRREQAVNDRMPVPECGEKGQRGTKDMDGPGEYKPPVRRSKQRTMGNLLAEFGN